MTRFCPSAAAIAAFVDGKIEGREHKEMVFHLNRCEACYQVVSEILVTQKAYPELLAHIDSSIIHAASPSDQVNATPAFPQVRLLPVLEEAARKDMQGSLIIKNNVFWAMGPSLIPLPMLDILSTTAVQLKMLKQLSALYQVPFSKHLGKSCIGILLGGLGVNSLSKAGWSLAKFVPGFGLTSVVVVLPLASGASTYAVGKIFYQHFALGGTFLDFNPKTVRNHFADLYTEGHTVASDLHADNHSQVA